MACTQFVGVLYGKLDWNSLNQLRCEKAANKVPPKRLLPTDDCFHLHLSRCAYQLAIWREAKTGIQELPPTTEYGYEVDADTQKLQPKLMNQLSAAPELLTAMVCDCDPICGDTCSCVVSEQPCSTARRCEAVTVPEHDNEQVCTNVLTTIELQFNDDSDSDDEM
jgi:hypothetical protein